MKDVMVKVLLVVIVGLLLANLCTMAGVRPEPAYAAETHQEIQLSLTPTYAAFSRKNPGLKTNSVIYSAA